LQLLPTLPPPSECHVAQAVSAGAGIATLLLLVAFLKCFDLTEGARCWTFGLIALNPRMISTSVQATNDAFVILFVSATIFAAWRFFSSGTTASFAAATACAVLAAISKGNGLVVGIAVACLLLALLVHPDPRVGLSRRAIAGRLVAFLVLLFAFAAPLGGYAGKYLRGGSPFAINLDPAPPPHLFEETVARRPGVTSIAQGYGTIRLLSMLEMPMITNDPDDYPRHRTSVWSQLYGRMHSLRFDGHPPAWIDRSPTAIWLGRGLLMLALLPSAILVVGVVRRIAVSAAWPARGPTDRSSSADLFLSVCMLGYLGFVIAYSYRYRDFSALKAIFVYPALLAFAVTFASELDRIHRPKLRGLVAATTACVLGLGILYLLDAALLAHTLFRQLFAG
jgi:hypothetical protein